MNRRRLNLNQNINFKSSNIFKYTLIYLAIAWTLSVFVDVIDIFNIHEEYNSGPTGYLWHNLFKEAGITEFLQWTFLSLSVLFSGMIVGKLHDVDVMDKKKMRRFFLILAIGMVLMLMEDAGNVRHALKHYTYIIFGQEKIITVGTELFFYSILGIIMAYAFGKYGKYVWKYKQTRKFFLIAFLLYGIISITSATRDIGNWYLSLGNLIHQNIFGGVMRDSFNGVVGFFIVDFWIEESVELLGASAFFTAILSYWQEIKHY